MRKPRFIPLDSTHETPPKLRLCDQESCELGAEFRAPKNPYHLHEYFWFCLEHVREYNKSWDFYRGMSPEEVEASRVSDITWNRPSWPIGGWRTLLENARYFDGISPIFKAAPLPPTLPKEVQKALGTLELALPLTMEVLKKQYKKLAKRSHPDLNPGNERAEEQLKVINESYQIVKKYITT